MARRSQCSSQGDNPLDPNYLPPHYREEYRLAVDALVEEDLQGYYEFLQRADVVDFLCLPEVEHIRRTVQFPCQNVQSELPYLQDGDNASSDTYWPLHSDLDAPSLDLGWPDHRSFLGPTEVSMLVNPSDPNMPSIKEQARRLISKAQQVIAVVMDMFTDVDIFADLLDAAMRNVAVYIVLDELNAQYFTAMVASCKVNLEMVQMMRVRTVSGSTYFCQTGKSFRGQMMDRFLLVDCKAVLSGNYSFMWSFEKIHRCIAHLFLGELVTTYDEEFRILYAQSQVLVTESALVPLPGESGYGSHTNPLFRGHLPVQSSCYASNLRQPFGDKIDRGEPFYNPLEPSQMQMYAGVYSSKHLRMEQSFMEQGRSMMTSRKMEMAHKRHSYAEGSHDSCGSSRQLMKHQVMNNLGEMEAQTTHLYKEQHYYHRVGPGSGHGINFNMKSQGYNRKDQYVDGGYPLEIEPPGSYSHGADYLPSSSSKDIIHDYANNEMNPKRVSQSYICQTSPTQLDPPDLSPVNTEACLNRTPQDPGTKQGLRNWRINSYLTTLDDEDEGLAVPLGQDPFDEQPIFSEPKLSTTDLPDIKFNTEEFPRITTSKRDLMPQYSGSNQPDVQKHPPEKYGSMVTDSKVTPEASELSTTTKPDKAGEEVRGPREISVIMQESFCSRVNPMLQRSSRLRSSLIFNSCNLEEKSSTTMKSASGLNFKENPIEEENGPNHTQPPTNVPTLATASKGNFKSPKDGQNMSCDKELSRDAKTTERHGATNMVPTDPMQSTAVHKATNEKSKESTEESSVKSPKDPLSNEKPKLAEKTVLQSFINMDDPEMRFLYFKQLAAERKAAKQAKESAVGGPALPENVTDTSLKTPSPSENLADSNMTDNSVMGKVPAVQEARQNPTETFINKPSMPITSAEPISNKLDVSVTQDQTAAFIQPAGSDLQCKDSRPSADVTMATKALPKGILKSRKDPKDKSKLSEMAQFKIPSEEKPSIRAPTETLPVIPSFINMDDPEIRFLYFKQLAAERKAAKRSKESAVGGPVLPENITGTSLKLPSISENCADTNIKPTVSITSAEPISNKPVVLVTQELANQTPAVIIQPAGSDLQCKDFQPSADVPMATEALPKGILKSSKDNQNISCDKELYRDPTNTKNLEIEMSSMPLTDPAKSLKSKTCNWSSDNRTVVHEATNQNSKESTEESREKSALESLPIEKPELSEMAQLKILPEKILSAPTATLGVKTSFLNMDDPETRFLYFRQLATERKRSKESAVEGPALPENVTDTILKMPTTSEDLADTNMTRTDLLAMGKVSAVQEATESSTESVINKPSVSCTSAQPISKQSEISVATELEDQSSAIIIQPARPVLQYKDTQPSAGVLVATKGSQKLFKKDILKLPEDSEHLKMYCDEKIYGDPTNTEKIAKSRKPGTSSVAIPNQGKSLHSKPFDCSSDNSTAVPEATGQKSKESTEESVKSPKDPLPKDKPKFSEREPKMAPEEKHVIIAPIWSAQLLQSRPSIMNMNDQKASERPKESVARGPDLSENITDSSLKIPAISLKLTDTSIETLIDKPPISITPANPISKKPEVSVAAGSNLHYKDSHSSADAQLAMKTLPKLVEKDIFKPSEDSKSLNISCDTDTEKHDIKEASRRSAASMPLTDPKKSLQNKTVDCRSDNRTAVPEATDQKSNESTEESTSEKSAKDPLPKEEPKVAPEERHVITATTETLPSTSSLINMNNRKPSEQSKESVVRGPDLLENITDSSLEIPGISVNLTDNNMKMMDISVMEKEPAFQEPTQNPKETVIDKPPIPITPANPISHKSKGSVVPQLETQNVRGVLGTQEDQKLAAVVSEDKAVSQTVSSLPESCEKPTFLESQSHTEANQATEIVVTKSKEEKYDNRLVSPATSKARTSTNSVIYSCNLRDDTKVILEQISAHSQNRIDLAKTDEGSTDDAKMDKKERSANTEGTLSKPHQGGTRFQHTPVNPQERENLLKRIEKMRKEKKVYSRFEMGS
ncbi:protein FAM83H-like isoform X2 [Conger conger]|uniref:protein FAM83H-like isoform X2 n=1 Tax=Conger conger TaxID=82655 RepID=UPI002A5AE3EE|nr:protein FAM83H-like isoform X2 [Conger conger]